MPIRAFSVIRARLNAVATACVFCMPSVFACAAAAQSTQPAAGPPQKSMAAAQLNLADAPEIEQKAIERMVCNGTWPRRAIAAVRLERYSCDATRNMLIKLLNDRSWQVRVFAIRSLARRRIAAQPDWFMNESEPRVLRCALRYRLSVNAEKLRPVIQALGRSADLENKMLAVELAAASNDGDLKKQALETVKSIILRMNRAEAGSLAPRLCVVTGNRPMYRPYDWQHWLMLTGRRVELQPGWSADERDDAENSRPASLLAQLDAEQFVGLEAYITKLSERQLDLAICLDCTASMSGEIAAAQGGIDDMMLFIGDIVSSLRVALVAYRDEHDDFETKPFDFTSDIATVRRQLWQLSADGGGDTPEAVYPAMQVALTRLHWQSATTKVLIVVGDAPPHVGYGTQCVQLAQQGREAAKLTTHMIQAKGKPVKHFPEIAKAGGGQCVALANTDKLMAEITGLTLADHYQDEFREFFQAYLELCR